MSTSKTKSNVVTLTIAGIVYSGSIIHWAPDANGNPRVTLSLESNDSKLWVNIPCSEALWGFVKANVPTKAEYDASKGSNKTVKSSAMKQEVAALYAAKKGGAGTRRRTR